MVLNTSSSLFQQSLDFDDGSRALTSSMIENAARNETQFSGAQAVGSGGSATVYTVPAGKVAYLVQILVNVCNTHESSASSGGIEVKESGGDEITEFKIVVAAGTSSSSNVTLTMPLKLTAGQYLELDGPGTGSAAGCVTGWLEDA